jgi:hypothetical protein
MALGLWLPLALSQVAELFASADFLWCIAGGHAIELAVDRRVREHADIDIFVLRRDQQLARSFLRKWDCWAADPPGHLRLWPLNELLLLGVHDVWCREDADGPWHFALMLNEADGDVWHSRRDLRVRKSIDTLVLNRAKIPYLSPDVQLFYKAKNPRLKDQVDFAAVSPLLTSEQRKWLSHSITLTYGGSHPWLTQLVDR